MPRYIGRHIVLGDLFRVNFSDVGSGGIFDAANHFGLEGLPPFDQFENALGVCLSYV